MSHKHTLENGGHKLPCLRIPSLVLAPRRSLAPVASVKAQARGRPRGSSGQEGGYERASLPTSGILTGEPGWRKLRPYFLDRFFTPYELYFEKGPAAEEAKQG